MNRTQTTVTKEFDNEGKVIKEITETVIEEDDTGTIYPQLPTHPIYPNSPSIPSYPWYTPNITCKTTGGATTVGEENK